MIKLRYINTFSRFKISRKCHSLILCWSIANNYELFQQKFRRTLIQLYLKS